MSHRVGQHIVHLIAHCSPEEVLGYMEVGVLSKVDLHDLVVDRLTGFLIVGRSFYSDGVCVEVLQLTRFAVLEEIGSEQIM